MAINSIYGSRNERFWSVFIMLVPNDSTLEVKLIADVTYIVREPMEILPPNLSDIVLRPTYP